MSSRGFLCAVRRCWRGEEELKTVFWIYYALVVVLTSMLVAFLGPLYLQLGLPTLLLGIVLGALMAAYGAWIMVSLWRCAYNSANRLWGHLTRILVVLILVGYAVKFYRLWVP